MSNQFFYKVKTDNDGAARVSIFSCAFAALDAMVFTKYVTKKDQPVKEVLSIALKGLRAGKSGNDIHDMLNTPTRRLR